MTNPIANESGFWKRFPVLVPILTTLIGAAFGAYGMKLSLASQQANSAEDRRVKSQELDQQRMQHAENLTMQKYEMITKFLPYLDNKNEEVRNMALQAIRDLNVIPVDRTELKSPSVARLFRPRPRPTPTEAVRNQQKARELAEGSFLPAENLSLSVRNPAPSTDSSRVPADSTREGKVFGLWRDSHGNLWAGGPCVEGQVCATITH